MMYFTHYEGRKRTLLFYFYLACYKVLYGYYKDIQLKDSFPVNTLNSGILITLQDFVAPFFMFLKTKFTMNYVSKTESLTDSSIQMKSQVDVQVGGIRFKHYAFEIWVQKDHVQRLTISYKNRTVIANSIQKPGL
jgi:hypothetical protein